MVNLFRHFLHLTKLDQLFTNRSAVSNQTTVSYEDLDLSENLSLDDVDLIFAINENSVIPAKNLATKKDSFTIVDLDQQPQPKTMENVRFKSALATSDIIFSASRQLAKALEQSLARHIIISRHLTEQKTQTKYINLKKFYHLINDTQLIIFDATINQNQQTKPDSLLKDNFTFIAKLMNKLPRYIHVIITGGRTENDVFNQNKSIFDKHDCASRVHFYIENLEAIKYPIDYSNIDIALLLGVQSNLTPSQYYKYLHEELVIFSTEFADANQLVTSANIGQIFDSQDIQEKNIEHWSNSILSFLNSSEVKRYEFKDNLRIQKQHINWLSEAKHFINSIMNVKAIDQTKKLRAVIVDLSKNQITTRTHNIGYMLVEQNIDVSILAPFLPVVHSPISNNIEYIKVS